MKSSRVKPNISFASVVSGNIKNKTLSAPSKIYTFQSPFKQRFSFPFDVIKYILKNPRSPDGLLKLYQTCKYFYSKSQIIIISGRIYEKKLSSKRNPTHDISKLKKAKLWFIDECIFRKETMQNYDFSKIYRSSIKSLHFCRVNIDFSVIKLLASENLIEKFIVCSGKIHDEKAGGKDVSTDAVLSLMPNLKHLIYTAENEKFSLQTLKNLNLIKFLNKFEKVDFSLKGLCETFDPTGLFKFVQQNASSESCEIPFYCVGENADEIKENLKAAEELVFPKEKRGKNVKIIYCTIDFFD